MTVAMLSTYFASLQKASFKENDIHLFLLERTQPIQEKVAYSNLGRFVEKAVDYEYP